MVENNSCPSDAAWGVVLLAHGSQRGSHTINGLEEVVRQLQERLDNAKVVLACLEFIEPDLVQAVASLSDEGFKRIVVMPFLLGQGTHANDDLEEEIGRALAETPRVEIHPTPPLGVDSALIEIVADRVKDSLPDDSTGMKGVLVVKAGTRHPAEDHRWFSDMGHMLESVLGEGYAVDVAQSHFGEPTMESAAARLVNDRGAASIVCVPYIFFHGLILTRNIEGGIAELENVYPHISFSVTPPLGVDERLVNLTASRIVETCNNFDVLVSMAHRAD